MRVAGAAPIACAFAIMAFARASAEGGRLVIVSPHNEQIRFEFSRGFSRWHEARYGSPVDVQWNTPGGTTEIRRLLVAQFTADLERNDGIVGGDADLLFGGGSYEFELLRRPITLGEGEGRRSVIPLQPIPFGEPWLSQTYGANQIGGRALYDPGEAWFGTALSTFGLVANTDLCGRLGIPLPCHWADLGDARLFNLVALANPGQSGSVATAFETVLLAEGWEEGWRSLRRAGANARSISGSSAKVPLDVADGESAVGVSIDFYAKAQAESLRRAAQTTGEARLDRLVFIALPDESVFDPDPVAMLAGAPSPELARRFVEYCLTHDGQALWQLEPGTAEACGLRPPEQFALRRFPILRSMYACCESCFLDKGNPFDGARELPKDSSMRPFVAPLFAAMAIDQRELLRDAWLAIISHPAYPRDRAVVREKDVTDPQLRGWLALFDAMPTIPGPNGAELTLAEPKDRQAVRDGWLRGGWADAGLWPALAEPAAVLRELAGAFFRRNYEQILAEAAAPAGH